MTALDLKMRRFKLTVEVYLPSAVASKEAHSRLDEAILREVRLITMDHEERFISGMIGSPVSLGSVSGYGVEP